jgi:hypothetical protein
VLTKLLELLQNTVAGDLLDRQPSSPERGEPPA